MAKTTDRFDVSKAIFFERLMKSWEKMPEKRFGQLIVEALDGSAAFLVITLRNIEDTQLAEEIERYVLRGD
jgi:hypothetical protein